MSTRKQMWRWLGAMPGALLLAFTMGAGSDAGAAPEVIPAGPLSSTGAIAYQFAVYLPEKASAPPMEALRQALKATAGAPRLTQKLDEPPKTAVVRATLNEKVATTYAPPNTDQIQRFGRGLSKEQAVALGRSRTALIMDFAHPSAQRMSAYRSSLLVVEQVARATGGVLWDEETREVFSADEWRKRRLNSWSGDLPDVPQQIVVHAYQNEGNLVRAISLGMSKFGLPDVVVAQFPWSSSGRMGWLLNAFAQRLGESAAMGAQGRFELDLRAIRHGDVRQRLLDQLSAKGSGKAALLVVAGSRERGDPENRLLSLRFDHVSGKDEGARQDAFLTGLFGSVEEPVSWIRSGDAALKAASNAAKTKLPALRDAFNKGLQPGEFIQVKAPFKRPEGGVEWMWVEVVSWSGDAITGMLKNEPAGIPALHAGQQVQVSQRDLFDYIRRYPDGRFEGNETSKIIERMR